MRVLSRFALVLILLSAVAVPLSADHLVGQCPLTLVDSTPATSAFPQSPHGVFTSGNQVFVLRGNTITTYSRNDAGDLQLVRSDLLGSLGAREVNGAAAFSNGFLFLSSEAGFEIFDLHNMTAGASGPAFVSRTPNLHYRRLAVSGNMVAGLFPATDLPCAVTDTLGCTTNIDLLGVANILSPVRITSIPSFGTQINAFNDIVFARGFLIATGNGGTAAFNISNPFAPSLLSLTATPGTFLTTNGTDLIGVGLPGEINVFTLSAPGLLNTFTRYTLPAYLTIDRANPIAFHPQMFFDDPNGRLVTMIDEINPLTRDSARTIAFDVFDFTVPQFEGSAPRGYEALSFVVPAERDALRRRGDPRLGYRQGENLQRRAIPRWNFPRLRDAQRPEPHGRRHPHSRRPVAHHREPRSDREGRSSAAGRRHRYTRQPPAVRESARVLPGTGIELRAASRPRHPYVIQSQSK